MKRLRKFSYADVLYLLQVRQALTTAYIGCSPYDYHDNTTSKLRGFLAQVKSAGTIVERTPLRKYMPTRSKRFETKITLRTNRN